jgi:uncharacterized protein (DUF608 family)
MIGTYNYFLYTNDTAFLASNWEGYQLAMQYITGKIDDSALLNVTGLRDVWSVAPQMGDLATAEGGFMTGLGKFQARCKGRGRRP